MTNYPLSLGRCLVCPNPPECVHGYCLPHVYSYCHCNRVEPTYIAGVKDPELEKRKYEDNK